MKRLATQIMALTLAAMFLLSFTGIRLLIHYCMSCDTTDVSLFGFAGQDTGAMHQRHLESSVCHISFEDDQTEAITCCDHDEAEAHQHCGDCCKSDVHYVKNDYEVPREKMDVRVIPVELVILLPNLLPDTGDNSEPVSKIVAVSDRPPPKPVGRDFVIFSHQLKIS